MITNSDLLKGFFTEPAFFFFWCWGRTKNKDFSFNAWGFFISHPSIQTGWCWNRRNLLQGTKVVDRNQIFVGQGLIMESKKWVSLYFHSSAHSWVLAHYHRPNVLSVQMLASQYTNSRRRYRLTSRHGHLRPGRHIIMRIQPKWPPGTSLKNNGSSLIILMMDSVANMASYGICSEFDFGDSLQHDHWD
jgi:hypothetical protein